MEKWNSISNLLLNNMKNLGKIEIYVEIKPSNYMIFLFKLFENSQSTLKQLSIFWATEDVLALPTIFLPNLHFCYLYLHPHNKIDVDTFDYLMKSFVSSCKHLKTFQLQGYDNRPKILKYIRTYYPKHFVDSPGISTSLVVHVPLKRSCLDLQDLAQYRYASCIEYLVLKLHSMEIYNPTEGDWRYYKEILSFYPNLKGINFTVSDSYNIVNIRFALAYHNICQERISYFEWKNIKILSKCEYLEILSENRRVSPSWTFQFVLDHPCVTNFENQGKGNTSWWTI